MLRLGNAAFRAFATLILAAGCDNAGPTEPTDSAPAWDCVVSQTDHEIGKNTSPYTDNHEVWVRVYFTQSCTAEQTHTRVLVAARLFFDGVEEIDDPDHFQSQLEAFLAEDGDTDYVQHHFIASVRNDRASCVAWNWRSCSAFAASCPDPPYPTTCEF